MNVIGQPERVTQNRVIRLFRDELHYRYLGDWTDRDGNSNIDEGLLSAYLTKSGYTPAQSSRAIHALRIEADNPNRSLYANNQAVYALLRYGVPVKIEAGKVTETVRLINWQEPEKNDFAIAEEVTLHGNHDRRPDLVLYVNGNAKGKCAVVTSYNPQTQDVTKEEIGANTETDKQFICNTYTELLEDIEAKPGMTKTETYEEQAKTLFTKQPANMKLLVVVDKLLTGFDAPPCTYLYIDKSMQDHGLFQAICRTNRLDGEDKDFGYIVDYKDLFKKVENAIAVYTSELDHDAGGADPEVLVQDRLKKGKERLDNAVDERGDVEVRVAQVVEPLVRSEMVTQTGFAADSAPARLPRGTSQGTVSSHSGPGIRPPYRPAATVPLQYPRHPPRRWGHRHSGALRPGPEAQVFGDSASANPPLQYIAGH